MNNYVALVADACGQYGLTHVQAESWHQVIDCLEDMGCEVIEDQSSDYDEEDFVSPASLNECGVLTLQQLHELQQKTLFVAFP